MNRHVPFQTLPTLGDLEPEDARKKANTFNPETLKTLKPQTLKPGKKKHQMTTSLECRLTAMV